MKNELRTTDPLAAGAQPAAQATQAPTSHPEGAATSQFTRKEGDGTPNALDLIRAKGATVKDVRAAATKAASRWDQPTPPSITDAAKEILTTAAQAKPKVRFASDRMVSKWHAWARKRFFNMFRKLAEHER